MEPARPAQERGTAGLPPYGFFPDQSSSAAEAAAVAADPQIVVFLASRISHSPKATWERGTRVRCSARDRERIRSKSGGSAQCAHSAPKAAANREVSLAL